MDLGEVLVKNDNKDGDGANGYGYNGTLTWAQTWATDYTYTSPVNIGTADPSTLYTAQNSGKLAEITDSVFFRNLFASAYTEATTVGVMDAAKHNVTAAFNASAPDENMPIQSLTRGALVTKGGKKMLPVTHINPCAANAAVVSFAKAPADGFFTPAPFRGAFSPYQNWLEGWTAVAAYGMTDTSMNQAGNGDLNGDGIVDIGDFGILSQNWLQVQ
jgi:hypothetical protein